MNHIYISNIRIDLASSDVLLQEIRNISRTGKKAVISNVNIHAMNMAHKNPVMKDFLKKSYINFIDGDGVNLGARILKLPAGPKVTYDWWIWELAEFSERNNLSWFILGSTEDTIRKAVKKLKVKYPGLNIKGYQNGFFKREGTENDYIVKEISACKPNILLVGMGMPVQEEWLAANWDKLDVNIALTGGAVIDYISGEFKSTPEIFRNLKLEWFYRFMQKPGYLFKRYFIGNPLFVFRVLKERFFRFQHQN